MKKVQAEVDPRGDGICRCPYCDSLNFVMLGEAAREEVAACMSCHKKFGVTIPEMPQPKPPTYTYTCSCGISHTLTLIEGKLVEV